MTQADERAADESGPETQSGRLWTTSDLADGLTAELLSYEEIIFNEKLDPVRARQWKKRR